jgi:transcriptional regulator with XRE-family HTH domain
MRKRKVTVVLGKKLRAIRLWKGITQTEMLQMVLPDGIDEQRARVSQWEKGTRQPPIKAQIIYAQIGGIPLEDLLNDERKLPAHLLVIHPRFSKKKNKQNEAKKGTSEKSNRRSNRAKDTGNAHRK